VNRKEHLMPDEPKAPTTRQTTGAHRADDEKAKDEKDAEKAEKDAEKDAKPTTVTNEAGTKVRAPKRVTEKLRGFS
jgi:hypothetical protein